MIDRPTSRRARPHLSRAPGLVGLMLIIASLAGTPTPAGAQARYAQVDVHVRPSDPQPGDTVTVETRISGCVPGGTTVEVYLTTSDGASGSDALMGRADAITTLLFRTKASVSLPNAPEGWYGVRVVCGQFRPARGPMANTIFAVGANPTKEATLSGNEVTRGGTLRFTGDGCPGTAVEFDLTPTGLHAAPFRAEGLIPVAPDGTWGTDLLFADNTSPGPTEVRARCLIPAKFGDTAYIYYGLRRVIVNPVITTVPPASLPPTPG